ncbi:exodeoxyribonuclease VII large subunit [Hylemonella sp. W303a]|uniref:exodeoxyribonuclease VII large subunit n=1 Tax=Hylemonella sp. W303a TaxID=3389873 RepID=UPI00396B45EB
MSEPVFAASTPRIWQVGALCRAVADTLDARFNPVAVRGEISGYNLAASGHAYFTLKDPNGRDGGQLRCAMFRRAASLLDFSPREGDQVEVRGRLSVYEARGDLQLIVESMARAGAGTLFEQFLRLKAKLEAEGLFDATRKRELPRLPRGIGVVTSLGAAALRDVATALRRRAPHVPVCIAPAAVQGAAAPAELVSALQRLYALSARGEIDVILLVRGGGSIEDLWAFNDEHVVRTIARSPVPVVSGVGHETDFTLADFVADLRAPTPTAAAELAAEPQANWLGSLALLQEQLRDAVRDRLDLAAQRLDLALSRLGRPSTRLARQRLRVNGLGQSLQHAAARLLLLRRQALLRQTEAWPQVIRRDVQSCRQRLDQAALRLQLLDPSLVLQRGYAWLTDADGHAVTRASQASVGQALRATLADGTLSVTVQAHDHLARTQADRDS